MSLFGYHFDRIPGGLRFSKQYRCFPISDAPRSNAKSLEYGGKILLPPSALEELAHLNIVYPMLFELRNAKENKTTHCGVLEFVAEEGRCYIPKWMLQQLGLQRGEIIGVVSTEVPVGRFVKLQPQSSTFLNLTNPRAVLENALRSFACLTENDVIAIFYNQKEYLIKVLETKPSNAISIIEADVEVDFAPPPDYVEPTANKPTVAAPVAIPSAEQHEEAEATPTPPSFVPFSGGGQSLSGRTGTPSGASPSPTPANLSSSAPRTAAMGTPPPPKAVSFSPRDVAPIALPPNTLLFGNAAKMAAATTTTAPVTAAQGGASLTKTSGFVPFGGSGKTLRG